MSDNPVGWINAHIEDGINLLEEGRQLQTKPAGDDWERRSKGWEVDLLVGVELHDPDSLPRVRTIGKLPFVILPRWHIWSEEEFPAGMACSSTGPDQPGNNPLSRHAERIERVKEIAKEWRVASPTKLRSRVEHPKAIAMAQEIRDVEHLSKRKAAKQAIDELGKGPHETPEAAWEAVRRAVK